MNSLWMSETFTPRCSFGTTRRFRISPASYVDLTQTFSRRGFPSLPCLRRCVKYLTNVRRRKDGNSRYPHKSTPFFRPPLVHSCAKFVCQSTSVVHFHWSRLARDHFRILYYLLTFRWQSVYGASAQYSSYFWARMCRPVLKTLTLFQTKICDFPHPISDPTLKTYTLFQTLWSVVISANVHVFFFAINVHGNTRYFKNVIPDQTDGVYTLFQTKMAKSTHYFRLEMLENDTLWGGQYIYGLYMGVHPPPPPPRDSNVHDFPRTHKEGISFPPVIQ